MEPPAPAPGAPEAPILARLPAAAVAAVLERTTDCVVVLDRAWRIVYANESALALSPLGRDALLGRDHRELFPGDAAAVRAEYERAVRDGVPVEMEEHFPGAGLWLEIRAFPLHDGLAVCFRDVTARRAAEERHARTAAEAAAGRERLARVFESLPAAAALLDGPDHVYAAASARYRDLVGGRELLGRPVREALPELAEQGLVDLLDRVYATGAAASRRALPVRFDRTGTGVLEERVVDFVYQPLVEEGRTTGIVLRVEDVTERERAVRAQSDHLSRLDTYVENSPLAVVEWDAEGRVSRWTAQAEEVFGWRAEEVLGRRSGEWPFVFPEDVDRVARASAAITRGDARHTMSANRNLSRDGRVLHCEWYNTAFRDANGRLLSQLSLVQDVTARRDAERRLAAQNAVLRVLAAAPDPAAALPRILAALGDQLEWALGVAWEPDEDEGVLRRAATWRHPAAGARMEEDLSGGLSFRMGEGLPGRVWRKGRAEWIRDVTADPEFTRASRAAAHAVHGAVAFPLRREGRVVAVVEFFTRAVAAPDSALLRTLESVASATGQFLERRQADVAAAAARREAEGARDRLEILAEASAALAAPLDSAGTLRAVARISVHRFADWCGVYVADADGQVRRVEVAHADAQTEAAFARAAGGWPRRRAPDDPVVAAVRRGETSLVEEVDDAAVARASVDDEHAAGIRALGVRSHIVVPMVVDGRILGALGFGATGERRYGPDDVALAGELARRAALALDRATLFEEALAASRAKSAFLATVSHELRTPLNAVLGYADLLLAGIPAEIPAGARAQVERIERASQHLLSIIEEILGFARLEAGRETPVVEPVDVPGLVRVVAGIAEPLAAARGLRFVAPDGVEHMPLRSDSRKLRQILINLLGNAVKFTDAGSVTLEVERDGDDAVFRVRDTGRGIPPERREEVFEPFRQLEEANTRTAGGTGLGLAVSRQLARLLGGDVTVEDAPGGGTVFTVRLPLNSSAM